MSNIQHILNNYVKSAYKLYNYSNLTELTKLKQNYHKSRNEKNKDIKYPLVKYTIKDKKVYVKVDWIDDFLTKEELSNENDKRIENIYNMINDTLEYAKKNNKPIPDTELYFWVSDRIPWYNNIDKRFPIFVYAKPINTHFIIFPDNTFDCMTEDAKYSTQCLTWDETKEGIIKKSSQLDNNKKNNVMFFKGTPTTRINSNIRENLNKISKDTKWLSVNLDGWDSYTPMNKLCEYTILLNLPGRFPWSNRFKYLFLMRSLVINIDVFSIDTEQIEFEPEWMTFINLLVHPKKHYINIIMKYYYSQNKDEKSKNKQLNHDEFQYVFNELKKIYNDYENNNSKYQKMISKGYEKISKLNNSNIYEYIYNCIIYNSKVNFI